MLQNDYKPSKSSEFALTDVLIQIMFVRETTKNDKKTVETGYYISSKESDAKTLLQAIQDHWKIESLHWQLDVIFSEDDCAVCGGCAAIIHMVLCTKLISVE